MLRLESLSSNYTNLLVTQAMLVFITSFVSIIYLSQVQKQKRVQNCHTCAEVKPQFFKPAFQTLIKAVRPWDRISVDFKGPVSVPHPYLLIVLDKHSRFPFVFPCQNMKSFTVMLCLSSLFCLVFLVACIAIEALLSYLEKLDPSSPLVASPSVPQLHTIHRGTANANALRTL